MGQGLYETGESSSPVIHLVVEKDRLGANGNGSMVIGCVVTNLKWPVTELATKSSIIRYLGWEVIIEERTLCGSL